MLWIFSLALCRLTVSHSRYCILYEKVREFKEEVLHDFHTRREREWMKEPLTDIPAKYKPLQRTSCSNIQNVPTLLSAVFYSAYIASTPGLFVTSQITIRQ